MSGNVTKSKNRLRKDKRSLLKFVANMTGDSLNSLVRLQRHRDWRERQLAKPQIKWT